MVGILDSDKQFLICAAGEVRDIAIDYDAANAQVLQIIKPVTNTERSLSSESPQVF